MFLPGAAPARVCERITGNHTVALSHVLPPGRVGAHDIYIYTIPIIIHNTN